MVTLEQIKSFANEIQSRVYLQVSFEEKEEAKKLGAKWDADARSWYSNEILPQFAKNQNRNFTSSSVNDYLKNLCEEQNINFAFFLEAIPFKIDFNKVVCLQVSNRTSVEAALVYLLEEGCFLVSEEKEEIKYDSKKSGYYFQFIP